MDILVEQNDGRKLGVQWNSRKHFEKNEHACEGVFDSEGLYPTASP